MSTQTTVPIQHEWTRESNSLQLAYSIVDHFARVEVADISSDLVPLMAAATVEITEQVGLTWKVTADETPVMLLRMLSRAAITHPAAGGPHCIALLDRLMTSVQS